MKPEILVFIKAILNLYKEEDCICTHEEDLIPFFKTISIADREIFNKAIEYDEAYRLSDEVEPMHVTGNDVHVKELIWRLMKVFA